MHELITRYIAAAIALAFVLFMIATGFIHRPCEATQTCEVAVSK